MDQRQSNNRVIGSTATDLEKSTNHQSSTVSETTSNEAEHHKPDGAMALGWEGKRAVLEARSLQGKRRYGPRNIVRSSTPSNSSSTTPSSRSPASKRKVRSSSLPSEPSSAPSNVIEAKAAIAASREQPAVRRSVVSRSVSPSPAAVRNVVEAKAAIAAAREQPTVRRPILPRSLSPGPTPRNIIGKEAAIAAAREQPVVRRLPRSASPRRHLRPHSLLVEEEGKPLSRSSTSKRMDRSSSFPSETAPNDVVEAKAVIAAAREQLMVWHPPQRTPRSNGPPLDEEDLCLQRLSTSQRCGRYMSLPLENTPASTNLLETKAVLSAARNHPAARRVQRSLSLWNHLGNRCPQHIIRGNSLLMDEVLSSKNNASTSKLVIRSRSLPAETTPSYVDAIDSAHDPATRRLPSSPPPRLHYLEDGPPQRTLRSDSLPMGDRASSANHAPTKTQALPAGPRLLMPRSASFGHLLGNETSRCDILPRDTSPKPKGSSVALENSAVLVSAVPLSIHLGSQILRPNVPVEAPSKTSSNASTTATAREQPSVTVMACETPQAQYTVSSTIGPGVQSRQGLPCASSQNYLTDWNEVATPRTGGKSSPDKGENTSVRCNGGSKSRVQSELTGMVFDLCFDQQAETEEMASIAFETRKNHPTGTLPGAFAVGSSDDSTFNLALNNSNRTLDNMQSTDVRGDQPENGNVENWMETSKTLEAAGNLAEAFAVEEEPEILAAVEFDPNAKTLVTDLCSTFRLATSYSALILVVAFVLYRVAREGGAAGLTREEQIFNVVVSSDQRNYLDQSSDLFRKTLEWIANSDTLFLPANHTNILQRFVMVQFYVSTATDRAWTTCWPPLENENDSCANLKSYRWLSGSTECLWAGVTCNSEGEVSSIDCSSFGLTGTIPDSIVLLSKLRALGLPNNELRGQIPQNLPSSLALLSLRNNTITGPFPPGIFALSGLAVLKLEDNFMSGTLPTEMNQLSSLSDLTLQGNSFEGSLPLSLFELQNIVNLEIGRNRISGTIPKEVKELSSLRILDIRSNRLTGTIPGDIFKLTRLQSLSLGGNQLRGHLPTGITGLSMLEHVDLKDNRLSGQVPKEIDASGSLEELSLSGNDFVGTIPATLCPPNRLGWLGFQADCQPDEMGLVELECSCCTECCDKDGGNCQETQP